VTEALHLLDRAAGWPGQDALWKLIEAGTLQILPMRETSSMRARDYMARFRDQPCDYADATILVAAEDTGCTRVFTIDSHFLAYRLTSGKTLTVLP
jgi:hypothetical protein